MPQLADVARMDQGLKRELEIRSFISNMNDQGRGPHSPLVKVPMGKGNVTAHWSDLFREEKRAYAEWVLS